ncbi:MAG: hypothetical protein U0T56_02325 [Ferruginibacter sp.]
MPTTTSTTNIGLCPSQLPYSWNSQTINAAGTYTATLTGSNGCDSVATLVLTINAVSTSTVNQSICPSQLPYSWNSQTYNSAGSYSVTLTGSTGCDSVVTLNLSVLPTTTSTTNQSVCPTQLPYSWNSQTINAAGTYTATLTGSNGCDSVATLVLTISAVSTSTVNQSICPSQLPYTWNSQTYNSAGTYSVTLTGSTGCVTPSVLNLSVLPTTTSTTNLGLCPSQLPYSWNSQTINAAGTYTATLTGSNGCDSIATFNLSINPASSSTVNQSICPSQLPYTWNSQTYNSAGTYPSRSQALPAATLLLHSTFLCYHTSTSTTNIGLCPSQLPHSWNSQTINAAGTYTATLTGSNGCDSVATLVLTISAVSTSTVNQSICPSQLPYTWNSQTYNSAGTYSVTLTGSTGCDSVVTLNLSVLPTTTSTTNQSVCPTQLPYTWNGQTYNGAGTYSVTLTGSNSCDSVVTLNLSVLPTSTSTTNFGLCPSQLPYSWNSQTINAAGTYTATLTGSNGCDSVATLVLTISAVSTSTVNQSICPSQLPYTWNSQTYNSAGTYSVTLTGSTGCDSVVTLNLSVLPTSTSTTNLGLCPSQLPYS